MTANSLKPRPSIEPLEAVDHPDEGCISFEGDRPEEWVKVDSDAVFDLETTR